MLVQHDRKSAFESALRSREEGNPRISSVSPLLALSRDGSMLLDETKDGSSLSFALARL
ncbi:MAG: hypothetical protein ABRQ36_01895 [Mesotoga sp.]